MIEVQGVKNNYLQYPGYYTRKVRFFSYIKVEAIKSRVTHSDLFQSVICVLRFICLSWKMHLKSLTYGLLGSLIHWMEGSPATAAEFTCCQKVKPHVYCLKRRDYSFCPILEAGQCANNPSIGTTFSTRPVEEGIEAMT